MTREEVEQKIREVLATETSAIRLSVALFAPDGLFSHLAANESERQVLVTTPLFREAIGRFTDLQDLEVEEFDRRLAGLESKRSDSTPHPVDPPKSHVA
jgi:hypothetical protein